MTWIILATIAQLFNAVVAFVDKHIVTDEKLLPKPFVYAFYSCLIAGGWIAVYLIGLIPLSLGGLSIPAFSDVERPTLEVIALSLLGAYTLFIALVSMFNALKQADASDVVPVIGAVSALGSFGLGYFFLSAHLSPNFIWGILLLSLGTFLVSRLRFPVRVAMIAIHSGLFFALHYISIKGLFMVTSFADGFFWSRIALVFFAISLLFVPTYYKLITTQSKSTGKKAGFLILGNKVLAGIASILILKATDLGDVAVVQALGGLQFVFLLGLGIILCNRLPASYGERGCRTEAVVQKAVFVAIITIGFLVLFR